MLNARNIEEWGPTIVAVAASVCWYLFDKQIPSLFAKELLAAIISAAAVGAGFLTTALSILMSLGSTAVGRQLKRRQRTKGLYNYLRSSIYSCLVVVVVCVGAFFSIEETQGISTGMSAVVVLFSAYCVTSMARIIEILIAIFRQMSESDDIPG